MHAETGAAFQCRRFERWRASEVVSCTRALPEGLDLPEGLVLFVF
ncbi:unnamed protein product [Amoebophrya sp. A25]|nr:unnamed protein product [Amoebophrya sp. A25]|eukprot:GSA25T00021353001.1